MESTVRLRSRGELIAAVPHLLGFEPSDSLVCLPLGAGSGPVARIDHPHNEEDLAETVAVLADCYQRHPSPTLAVLAITADPAEAARTVVTLTDALDGYQAVTPALWVHEGSWVDLATGERGTISHDAASRLAAEAVGRGQHMPESSRAALAESLRGDPSRLAPLMQSATERARSLTSPGPLGVEAAWVADTIEEFRGDQVALDDPSAARMLAAVHDTGIRDAVLVGIRRSDAESNCSLWRDMTRRAPAEVRTPAATMLAFSSWLAGNGAQAWVALDLVEKPQEYPLADLVATALQTALHPDSWERTATGADPVSLQRAQVHQPESPSVAQQDHRTEGPARGTPGPTSGPGR